MVTLRLCAQVSLGFFDDVHIPANLLQEPSTLCVTALLRALRHATQHGTAVMVHSGCAGEECLAATSPALTSGCVCIPQRCGREALEVGE